MTPTDYIVLAAILLIVGGAIFYIVKSKKSGKKCIGCPYADSCSSNCCDKGSGLLNDKKKHK